MMAHMCAENNNFMAYHMPGASAQSEASLMAIAQQLVQQQQQKHLQCLQSQQQQHVAPFPLEPRDLTNPWSVTTLSSWRSRSDEPPVFTTGICSPLFGDPSPTSGCDFRETILPSVELHLQDSSFVFRDNCIAGYQPIFDGDMEIGLKPDDCGLTWTGIYQGLQREQALAEITTADRLTSKKRNIDEVNVAICTSQEMGELVGYPLSTIGMRLPNLQSTGLESSETTASCPTDLCMGDVGDASSEWMDCLISDLQSDEGAEGVASCFDSNPCESTESSELPVAGSCYPCSPEDAWPDGFTVLEEALCTVRHASTCLPPTSWTHDTTNLFGSSPTAPPELTSSNSQDPIFVKQGVKCWPAMQEKGKKCRGSPVGETNLATETLVGETNLATETGTWRNSGEHDCERGIDTEKLHVAPKIKLKAELERAELQVSDHGLQLLHLLLDCAKTIDIERDTAKKAITRLRPLCSKQGDPIQRLASYFSDALAKRLSRGEQGRHDGCSSWQDSECCSCSDELMVAYKALNDACPYFKFAELTANQAILEATETAEKVHIIDFGISQGVQWAALLQAFATRPSGAKIPSPRIRITGIASPSLGDEDGRKESLFATGRRLTEFAKLLDLEFEFHPIASKMEELDVSMFRIEEGESVAVNFMLQLHHMLGESILFGQNPLHRLLKVVHSLSPKVVTLAEYDARVNCGAFQERFLSALHFYCAIFESLDATMPRDCADRMKMERFFFAEKLESMLGCEGEERKARLEGRDEWHKIMGSAGFTCVPLSHYAISQARLLLWWYCDTFSLTEGHAQTYVSLGWQQRPLVTVSAWSVSSAPPFSKLRAASSHLIPHSQANSLNFNCKVNTTLLL